MSENDALLHLDLTEIEMKTIYKLMGTLALIAPLALAAPAEARHQRYKTFVGKDGHTYCRKADGTLGAVIGGVAGGVLGHEIAGRGDRTLGTIIGVGGGAVAGRAIERRRRTHCG